MISINELLSGNKLESQTQEIKNNLNELLEKINKIRASWGNPMTVTSGLRSKEHHIQVYENIAKKKGIIFDISKVPMGSRHLSGQAVDISDPNRELQAWCLSNQPTLESIGLWMEDFSATSNWCHFQTVAPKSGARFFKP